TEVSYYRQIRPIIQQKCQGCHQPAKPQGGYVMTVYSALFKTGESEQPGVVAGDPQKSWLMGEIAGRNGKPPKMPKNQDSLPDKEVELIRTWIAQGAKDDTPPSAKVVVDNEHPPTYVLPPVIPSIDFSPDGKLLAVAGYHEVLLHKADGS